MMQDISLNFGVSGEERKRLVKAVSTYKQVPSEYLGVPSFAFRVDEMIIDRDGVLVIEGGMEDGELSEFLQYLREKGFQADHAIPHPGDTEEAVTEDEAETESAVDEYTVEVAVAEDPTEEPVIKAAVDTVVKEAADAPEDAEETVTDPEGAGTEVATEEAVDEHRVEETVTDDLEAEPVIETVAEKPMIMVDVPVTEDTDMIEVENITEEAVFMEETDDKTPAEENTAIDEFEQPLTDTERENSVIEDPSKNEDSGTQEIVAEDMTEAVVVEEATSDDPEDTGIDEDEPLLTIQIPREGFTEQSLATLQLIIKSKEYLLKKSLNTKDLGILITDDRISFPWFQKNDLVSTSAYMHLVTAICDMAKRAKRVTVTNQDIESEKYAFRTWLIRLGFGGPEFKTQRAVLLQNLSGTSAFKNREAAEAFNERMKAKRATTAR